MLTLGRIVLPLPSRYLLIPPHAGSAMKPDRFAEHPFSYAVRKNGELHIFRDNAMVTSVRGANATKLVSKLNKASADQAQLILAKATGNYKRGNER